MTLCVVLLMLSAVAACGGGRVIQSGDVSVLVSERPDFAMNSAGGGRLTVIGGCLGGVIGQSEGVIIWPHGTTVVDDDPLTIEVPEHGTFGLGDEISLGGGWIHEPASYDVEPEAFDAAGVTVPARCAAHAVFLSHALE